MKIQEASRNNVLILLPQGRIDSLTSESFDEKIKSVLDQNPRKILIDFSGTDFISRAGLRVLLMTAKTAKAQNCKMRLCSLNEILKDIFDVSGFVSLFSIDPKQEDSLEHFKAGS